MKLSNDSIHLKGYHPHTQRKNQIVKRKKWYLCCSVYFKWSQFRISPQSQSKSHLVQHNKQLNRKELLSSFHLNGHTSGFHPQTRTTLHSIVNSTTGQHCSVVLFWTITRGFHPRTQDRITRYRTIEGKGAKKWKMLSFNSPPIRKKQPFL